MKRENIRIAGILAAALLPAALCAHAGDEEAAAAPRQSDVEVVFVLDTTGSMGGLIEGAKQKIWSIANEIAKGKPTPKIKMGLVAYRDKGDQYVARAFDLSANLDRTYRDLLSLRAAGGGDDPEHVLKALDEAVERVSWSKDTKTFKVVYLVGDAPPHFNYGDTPTLERILENAVRKGIIVNSIQCGTSADTSAAWQKIARLGEGKYLAIAQDGGVVALATPYDERIAALNSKLESTALAYGARRAEAAADMALSRSVLGMAGGAAMSPASAERAIFKSRAGFDPDRDLGKAVEEKRLDLAKLEDSELPDALRGLSPEARKARIDATLAERRKIKSELDALADRRAAYLRREAPRTAQGDSFDARLVDSLKEQAARKGIAY